MHTFRPTVRPATHAGSWYSDDPDELRAELNKNLAAVRPIPSLNYNPPVVNCRAVIAPHAGYSYSGPAAAWSYAAVPVAKIKRVFILGPSHHHYISKIALSPYTHYATPLGDLPLDLDVITELSTTLSVQFPTLSPSQDAEEHSLELHLPYIRHVFAEYSDVKIVPLQVGSVGKEGMEMYAEVLEKWWRGEENFWVVSSDFCHWGTRFSHTPFYPSLPSVSLSIPPDSLRPTISRVPPTAPVPTPLDISFRGHAWPKEGGPEIWESIRGMDEEACEVLQRAVEGGEGGVGFREYLKRTQNTICGRNPILLLLSLISRCSPLSPASSVDNVTTAGGTISPADMFLKKKEQAKLVWVRYEQSSKCRAMRDSSVSYVSGVVVIE